MCGIGRPTSTNPFLYINLLMLNENLDTCGKGPAYTAWEILYMRIKANDLAFPRNTSTEICETRCPITLVSVMMAKLSLQYLLRKVKLKKNIFKNPTLKMPFCWCYTGSLVRILCGP